MAEQNKNPVICPNGHAQRVSGSRFCIHCGVALNVQSAPPRNNAPQSPPKFVEPNPPVNNRNQQPGNQNHPPPNSFNNNPQPPPNHPPPFNQTFQTGQQQYIQPMPQPQMIQALQCYTCGGNGQNLNEKTLTCKECRWLRPLIPGYQVDSAAFEWAADGKAMAALRSIKTLNAAARAVSEKVGRHWIESTFNGVLLSEKQLPEIYGLAIQAAQILGMSHMPDIYVSGERSWDCLTFGSDRDSFIVIGSALAGSFQKADMLFLLAREMGHCRAGHALWKTVIRFFLGEQGNSKGVMAGGIFNAIINPAALIEGAIEMPLLAWARQAEITADRAGLLIVGDEEVARRVLLTWSLKSAFIYRQINIEAWMEQQSADGGGYSKLSELTTTSTPYIIPRLRLLTEFAGSQELQYWRGMISNAVKQSAPPEPVNKAPVNKQVKAEIINLKCSVCKSPMRIPLKILAEKKELPVKCPNPKCGKITRFKRTTKSKASAPPKPENAAKLTKREENMNYGD
ncbi:MAG: M48 family metalloprotease [Pyrinomonadaceae bacterium]